MRHYEKIISEAWKDKSRLHEKTVQAAIQEIIAALDIGTLRVARPMPAGQGWEVYPWIKQAIMLYFMLQQLDVWESGPLVFHDKIPLKQNYKALGVRVVPPAVARYGAYLQQGVILMGAAFVNIGAYVGEGTMIDIGAVIGSCAQLGKHIHVSAGVTIGGVLEPVQANPVVIEDNVFIGSGCAIVEGVFISHNAVLGANVTLTASTKIIDVTQADAPKTYRGYVPANVVVIPGCYPKQFPAGLYYVPCALIIGQRTKQTDAKVALNKALRAYHG